MAIRNFSFLRNSTGVKKKDERSKATFRDVALPLSVSTVTTFSKSGFKTEEREHQDLDQLTDIPAIVNAFTTLLMTRKGGRPLVPRMGLDLREYIGEPLEDEIKLFIEEDIVEQIQTYEPRVSVEHIEIEGDPDDNSLHIEMRCGFPNLQGQYKDILITVKGDGSVFTGYR